MLDAMLYAYAFMCHSYVLVIRNRTTMVLQLFVPHRGAANYHTAYVYVEMSVCGKYRATVYDNMANTRVESQEQHMAGKRQLRSAIT